jgi:hypothetical protein
VDLLYFVNERLKFIRYFHESTVSALEETKRKIEAGEPPYVDTRCGEDANEPGFLEEWENADTAVNITGATCLELLQSTLHSFLHEYMATIGGAHLIPRLGEMKKKSWFGNYRELFRQILQIDWDASGADISLMEQMILTRNDFTHNLALTTLNAYQTEAHSKKYPDTAFADPRFKKLMFRVPLIVPKEKLDQAIGAVYRLCEYLEDQRREVRRQLRARQGDQSPRAVP